MSQAVDLQLRPSARAHHLLFWLHVLPLALLPAAMQTGAATVAIAFVIGLSWLWVRRHPAFGYGSRAIVRIVSDPEGRWSLQNSAGTRLEAELLGDSTMLSRILVLNFRSRDGRRRTRVLLGDEAPPEALRRLRARLITGDSASSRDRDAAP